MNIIIIFGIIIGFLLVIAILQKVPSYKPRHLVYAAWFFWCAFMNMFSANEATTIDGRNFSLILCWIMFFIGAVDWTKTCFFVEGDKEKVSVENNNKEAE